MQVRTSSVCAIGVSIDPQCQRLRGGRPINTTVAGDADTADVVTRVVDQHATFRARE